MRIKLFNKKTLYEIYDIKVGFSRFTMLHHIVIKATLASKEDTLAPKFLDCFTTLSHFLSRAQLTSALAKLRPKLEEEFINHLNENVGFECLIRKEEVPIEVYRGIKS